MNLLDGTFFQKVTEKSVETRVVAGCKKCSPNYMKVKGFRFCTSNFITHLKRKHRNQALEEYRIYAKNKRSRTARSSTTMQPWRKSIKSMYNQEQFNVDMVNYFTHSMIPLRCVENPYFLKTFENFDIRKYGLNIITRRNLSRLLCDSYENEAQDIKRELVKTNYICTTVDIWSGHRRSFLGVIDYWIDAENLQRKSRALAYRRFAGVHSNERIAELLHEIHTTFVIGSKIVATVSDNGSNFVKAFKRFGVHSDRIEEEECFDLENSDADSSDDE